MLRCLSLLVLCLVLASELAHAEDSVAAQPYFPTAIGTEWVFEGGGLLLVERIAKYERVGQDLCLRIETSAGNKVIAFEHLLVRPDGVYRASIGGKEVTPPLKFASFPPKLGETWNVDSTVLGQKISGKFQTDRKPVTVPAGKYDTLAVLGTGFKSGSTELKFTYNFAPGVGKVRQVIAVSGQEATLELKEFHKGE